MPRLIIRTRQSSQALVGCCYGYSSFWARGQLNLPHQERIHEIPLNSEIAAEQWSQAIPTGKQRRLANFYIDYWHQNDLIDDIKKGLTNIGDAFVISYLGAFAGHALAIKKIGEDRYQYFDCNIGVYEFDSTELDKLFSDYISPRYQKIFYGLVLEHVPANDVSPDLLGNVLATAYIAACKIISTPIGIFKYIESLVALIAHLVSNEIGNSNNAPHNESTALIR